jgi:hypothetical protein
MTNSPFIPYSGHNKLSALLTGPHFSLLDWVAKALSDLWHLSVPEGYQDETGFHPVPVRSTASRPPVEAPVWLGEYI